MENFEKDKIKEEVNQDPALEPNQNQEEQTEDVGSPMPEETPVEDVAPVEDENGTEDGVAAGDTLTPNPEEQGVEEQSIDPVPDQGENSTEEMVQQPEEKMLTQSQVNELVGKARQEGRESAMKELLTRYGVNTDGELNDIFGRGQAYDDLNDEFTNQGNSLRDVMAENALLKSSIIPERWDDVKLILGGKGMDVSPENIESMITTHPEWIKTPGATSTATGNMGGEGLKQFSPEMGEELSKAVPPTQEQPGTLRKMGNQVAAAPKETDEQYVQRIFGF